METKKGDLTRWQKGLQKIVFVQKYPYIMRFNVKLLRDKIVRYYFSNPGYSYINDPYLSYGEAVLIHYTIHHLNKKYIDTDELDALGRYYPFWWKECLGHFEPSDGEGRSPSWETCLSSKIYNLPNYFYDKDGNRISWKEVEPYKQMFEYETVLKEQKYNGLFIKQKK